MTSIKNNALFSGVIITLVIFSFFAFFRNVKAIKEQKPNVLFIMVDDMNDWVGYLNGYKGEVYTPNIDRLASEGLAFTNAHVSAPSCTPSRNSILLGKFTSNTGLYGNDQWWKTAHPDIVSLPQYFKDHGYYSAGAGKVFHHPPGHNPPVSWNEYQDQVFDDMWNFSRFSPENCIHIFQSRFAGYSQQPKTGGFVPALPPQDMPLPANLLQKDLKMKRRKGKEAFDMFSFYS